MLLNLSRRPIEHVDSVYEIAPSLAPMRSVLSCRRGERIYGDTDLADHWYCVLAGAVRKYALLSDGRRQIVDFLLPGDFFGFRERHQQFFATDAIISGTTIARYPRRSLQSAADADSRLARQILEVLVDSISRSQARLLIMGRVTSTEKVRAFLVEMTRRCFDRRQQCIVLPMSRYDIADYLGLSVETVSRALSRLRGRKMIRFVDKHTICILDRRLLEKGLEEHARRNPQSDDRGAADRH
jgi:CRP/FNR family nitrogen fixation transcriptional regulator